MVKKTKTPNSQPDDFKIETNIINAETKGIINEKKEDKQSLDNELISRITNSIDLINSKINELNAKTNLISKEAIDIQIDKKIGEYKNNTLDKVLKIAGIIATIIVPMLIYFKTPSDLSIQNTINETYKNYKADTKEYINEQLQKQIEKIVDEKIKNITLKK